MKFTDDMAANISRTSPALASFANAAVPSSTARMIRFDARQFHPRLFNDANIACPGSVARSVAGRQAEFFFGRACAKEALGAMGIPDVAVPIGKNREPVWPIRVVGSISHNAMFAAAIVAPASAYRGIGIDIEAVPPSAALDSILATVVSRTELALLQSQSCHSRLALLLTAVFSAKESFFKATFNEVGQYFGFDAINVEAIDMKAGVILFRQNIDLSPTLPAGTRHQVSLYIVEPGTVCTLFARKAHRDIL
jgi:4'-phosphopantetheinyl transferase EntD